MRTFSHPVSTQPAVSHRPSLAPRTAFVLAGGGSLGAMQVGRLRGLYERGVAPDLGASPSDGQDGPISSTCNTTTPAEHCTDAAPAARVPQLPTPATTPSARYVRASAGRHDAPFGSAASAVR
jgi:hypothetical protein